MNKKVYGKVRRLWDSNRRLQRREHLAHAYSNPETCLKLPDDQIVAQSYLRQCLYQIQLRNQIKINNEPMVCKIGYGFIFNIIWRKIKR